MRWRNCSAPLPNLSLLPLTYVSTKYLLSDSDPGEAIHFHLNQLFQITRSCCIYKENYTFFSLGFTEGFLFGKHLLVSFSCCDRFHSELLAVQEEPLQTPNPLQGLLRCQAKGNMKAGGREQCSGSRIQEGPLMSTSIEKQPVRGETAQACSIQGRVPKFKF